MKNICFFLIPILISCSSTNDSKIKKEMGFVDLYHNLPQIDLPMSMQTSSNKMFDKDLPDLTDSILIERFGSRGGFPRPLGKLYNDSNIYIVLSFIPDDVGTPIISTYNETGQKIDSFMIFDDKPASTRGSWTKEFATIQKDMQIEFLDSTENLDSMDRVVDTVVIKKVYFINKNGFIKQK